MKGILVRTYDQHPIEFRTDGWVNATSAAIKRGKRVSDWLKLKATKEYIEALEQMFGLGFRSGGSSTSKNVMLQVSRAGKGGQDITWLHPRLAVNFTRWVDVRFAIWCDLQIEQIIRGYYDPPRSEILTAKRAMHEKMMDALLERREEEGKETAEHHYMNENRLCNFVVTGQFTAINEKALSNEDAALLEQVRDRNRAFLLAGLDYETRKARLLAFAVRARTRLLPQPSATPPPPA